MTPHRTSWVAPLILWILAGTPLRAQNVVLDFEHYPGPDDTLGTADDVPTPLCPPPTLPPCSEGPVVNLSTEYSAVGVTFSQGTLHYAPSLWPGHDHYLSSAAPVATLSLPVHQISITSYSSWNATLTGYDAADNVLATSILTHPAPGAFKFLGTLSLFSTLPIARFSVLPDTPGHILNLDDLAFGVGNDFAFFTLTPCRLVDTRTPSGGPSLSAGEERTLSITANCGVPPTARAISINVAVTEPTTPGNLRLYPAGMSLPLVSAINYGTGQTRSNNAIVGLTPTGKLTVRCAQASGTAHFILDVNGYFE